MEPHLPSHSLAPSPASRDAARAGLYVHVPFCARRCTYCDFSTGPLAAAGVRRYLAALAREAERRAPQAADLAFTSVFLGGGTPSSLPAAAFEGLWTELAARFRIAPGAEITLEANPESVRPERLEAWARAGVNRLSIGAQTFQADELAMLGRIHDAARPGEAFALARRHGFRRLSLDLMFGFPGHTAARWADTVERALALEPEHLSAYCFIPEPGTPLGDAVARGATALPSPEAQAEAYAWLTRRMTAAGFACYETSNFCRPGAEARHNLVYWLRRPYVGLGPSAHGFTGGVRYGNHHALEDWAAAIERGAPAEAQVEPETAESVALETMMLGLRLSGGLARRDHPEPAWRALTARYAGAFEAACATGRLARTADGWRIASRHRFVADDVIAWIEARADDGAVDRHSAPFLTSVTCPILPSQVA